MSCGASGRIRDISGSRGKEGGRLNLTLSRSKMSEWDRIRTVFAKTTAPYAYIKKNTPTSFPNLDKPAARGRKHHPPSVYPAEWPRAAHFNFPAADGREEDGSSEGTGRGDQEQDCSLRT